MKKRFILIIFLIIGLIYFFVNNFVFFSGEKKLIYGVRERIEYIDYDQMRDLDGIKKLMEKYKFWLFHGEFKNGENPVIMNFNSGYHIDDLGLNVMVPYIIRVVRDGERVVGFVSYYISENVNKRIGEKNKIGRIHLLCVEEDYRRFGIGKKLIKECMDFFKLEHCDRVYLITRPENIRAKSLYYKFGFSEIKNDNVDAFDKDPADILVNDF